MSTDGRVVTMWAVVQQKAETLGFSCTCDNHRVYDPQHDGQALRVFRVHGRTDAFVL